MRKSITGVIFALSGFISLFLPIPIAGASPMIYNFTGDITSFVDNAGIVADAGLQGGSGVEFTFIIDFDQPGSRTRMDGSVEIFDDYILQDKYDTHAGGFYREEYRKEYFYTEYVSGTHLSEKDGGYYNSDNFTLSNNAGYDEIYITRYSPDWIDIVETYWYQGTLVGGSTDETVLIQYEDWNVVEDIPVSGWQIGDSMTGISQAFDSEGGYSYYWANLTLNSISPVPEPSTLLLLGTGLIGLCAGARRKIMKD